MERPEPTKTEKMRRREAAPAAAAQSSSPSAALAAPARWPAPRCHGNRPPRNPAFLTGDSAHVDPAPTPGQRGASTPLPSPTQEKQKPDHRVKSTLETLRGRCPEPAAPSPAWSRVRDQPASSFPAAPARHPARGATWAAEKPSPGPGLLPHREIPPGRQRPRSRKS